MERQARLKGTIEYDLRLIEVIRGQYTIVVLENIKTGALIEKRVGSIELKPLEEELPSWD